MGFNLIRISARTVNCLLSHTTFGNVGSSMTSPATSFLLIELYFGENNCCLAFHVLKWHQMKTVYSHEK